MDMPVNKRAPAPSRLHFRRPSFRGPFLVIFFCISAVRGQVAETVEKVPPPSVNQPVVVNPTINSSEKVEMEKLRMAREMAAQAEAERRRRQSGLGVSTNPASFLIRYPEYQTFLAMSETGVSRSAAYQELLTSALNDLSAESPYLARGAAFSVNPQRAARTLREASRYAEDGGLSQTIINHVRKISESRLTRRNDSAQRVRLEDQVSAAQWNIKMSREIHPMTKKPIVSDVEVKKYEERIAELRKEIAEIDSREGARNISEKVQFQAFILQLFAQRRYLHALIATGFYTNSFGDGDIAIDSTVHDGADKQYQSAEKSRRSFFVAGRDSQEGPGADAIMQLPNTITGMESFLRNMVYDSQRKREALDNMLRERQLTGAEKILVEMVATAKYQPELQTLPYRERQRIQEFARLKDRLYATIQSKAHSRAASLATEIEGMAVDYETGESAAFAEEEKQRALSLITAAEVAAAAADPATMQSLLLAAREMSPHDAEVQTRIDSMQKGLIDKKQLADQLQQLVKDGNYRAAYERREEFLSLPGGDAGLKKQFENLLDQETKVLAAVARSREFERLNLAPEAWLAADEVPNDIAGDARLIERKADLSLRCPDFVTAVKKARDFETSRKAPLALAWYLTAQSQAATNQNLKEKVEILGAGLLREN